MSARRVPACPLLAGPLAPAAASCDDLCTPDDCWTPALLPFWRSFGETLYTSMAGPLELMTKKHGNAGASSSCTGHGVSYVLLGWAAAAYCIVQRASSAAVSLLSTLFARHGMVWQSLASPRDGSRDWSASQSATIISTHVLYLVKKLILTGTWSLIPLQGTNLCYCCPYVSETVPG